MGDAQYDRGHPLPGEPTAGKTVAIGCLSQLGLAALIGGVVFASILLTIAIPPWVKVTGERRQVIWTSRMTDVRESKFAGYHFLLSGREWQTDAYQSPRTHSAGETFAVIEYRIYWRLLFVEWIVIAIAGALIFALVAWQLYVRRQKENRVPG